MNLKHYYAYIEKFEYLCQHSVTGQQHYEITTIEFPPTFDEESGDFFVSTLDTAELLISESEEEIIESFIEETKKYEQEAKSQLIHGYFLLSSDISRVEYINYLSQDFFYICKSYLETYEKFIPLCKNSYTITCKFVLDTDIYYKYVYYTCYDSILSWLNFLKGIIDTISNVTKKEGIYQTLSDTLSSMLLLIQSRKKTDGQLEVINIPTLKDYMKSPSIFNWLLNQPEIRELLSQDGREKRGENKNKQKQELSSLLHFLNDNNFFNKKYTSTIELPQIGEELYGISHSLITKKQGKNVEIFSSILSRMNNK